MEAEGFHPRVCQILYAEKKETKLSVQKDHFVSAPVLQNIAKEILEETKSLDAAKNEAIKLLEDKITRIGAGNRAISDYCDAIFTGVITLEGYMVAYRKSEFGIVTETILSKRGDEFPFSSIPAYQGFLSYQSLLDDDMRAAIKKSVDERYNANSPEIRATGTMLKEELADIKVQAWVTISNTAITEPLSSYATNSKTSPFGAIFSATCSDTPASVRPPKGSFPLAVAFAQSANS